MFWRAAPEKAIVRKKSREHLLLFLPSSGTPTSRLAPPQQDWRRPRQQPPQQPSLRRRLSKKTHYRERKGKNSLSNRNIYCSLQKIAYFKAWSLSLSRMRQRSISQTASSLQSWNENLRTSKFATRIVAKDMQKKKKRSRGRKGETLVLFCVCTVFLCRFLCVCRLLCQTSLWRLDCKKEDGEPKTKNRTVGKWLVLSYSDELLSFFLSFFLPSFSVLACVSPNSRTLSWPNNQKTNKKYVPLSTRRSSFCTRVRSLQ